MSAMRRWMSDAAVRDESCEASGVSQPARDRLAVARLLHYRTRDDADGTIARNLQAR